MADKADLMTKAMQYRKELGAESGSPVDVFSLAQNIEGLTLVYYPMGDKLSGMCVRTEDGNCVIAVNSGMSLGRQRFSLAHEFYHMRFDDNMTSICGKKIGCGNDIEKEADIFASYFLMPAAELESRAARFAAVHEDGKLSLDDVILLEQYFGVSHQAAVIRLKESRCMERSRVEEFLKSSVRGRAEMMGCATALYRPLPPDKQYMTYGSYIKQAELALQKGLIAAGKYEELLLCAFRSDLVYGGDEEAEIID
ncbi:MAG: ImmA/IrrE family metallo-endopeptidase [Cloacibacillus sp.]